MHGPDHRPWHGRWGVGSVAAALGALALAVLLAIVVLAVARGTGRDHGTGPPG